MTTKKENTKQTYADLLNVIKTLDDNKINQQCFKSFIEILKDQYTDVIDFTAMTKEEIKIIVEQTLPSLLERNVKLASYGLANIEKI